MCCGWAPSAFNVHLTQNFSHCNCFQMNFVNVLSQMSPDQVQCSNAKTFLCSLINVTTILHIKRPENEEKTRPRGKTEMEIFRCENQKSERKPHPLSGEFASRTTKFTLLVCHRQTLFTLSIANISFVVEIWSFFHRLFSHLNTYHVITLTRIKFDFFNYFLDNCLCVAFCERVGTWASSWVLTTVSK